MSCHFPFDYKKDANKVLFEFDEIARKMGIQCFLLAGVCLGFVRDKGYIKGDNDIDVGIKCSKEKREKFFRKLEKSGFRRGATPGGNRHYLKNKILIDVFFRGKNIQNPYADSFRKIVYNKREFNVFKKVEEYLTSKYGKWKIPIDAKTFSRLKHKRRKK